MFLALQRGSWHYSLCGYNVYIRIKKINSMARVRTFKELDYKEKALIAKERLLNPEIDKSKFAKSKDIDVPALRRIEKVLNFDSDVAAWAVIRSIMEKDSELIELSTDIKNKWAQQVNQKKVIQNKDIETIDRIENTAIKRQAIMKATQDAEKEEKALDIKITL